MKFPKCRRCGHVFEYTVGLFKPSDKTYINLQRQWSDAHTYGGESTTVVTCPSCGNQCEVGYKCEMKPVSRNRKVVGE